MNTRIASLTGAHGPVAAAEDHTTSQGWSWRLEGRVYLLYARGQARIDGARWATEGMSRVVEEAAGRRIYIAWSFEDIEGYGPGVGMHFVDWFAANRQSISRFMVLTENSILRMTARTASLAVPSGTLRFPRDTREFDAVLGEWLARVRQRAAQL